MSDIALKKIKIIGVGSAGINIVSSFTDKMPKNIECIYIDYGNNTLTFSSNSIVITVDIKFPCEFNIENYQEIINYIISKKNLPSYIFSNSDSICFVSGFGKKTGSCITPAVAKIASDMGIRVTGIPIIPFKFEGRKYRDISKEAINQLHKYATEVISIDMDTILHSVHKKLPLASLFQLITDKIYIEIQKIYITKQN